MVRARNSKSGRSDFCNNEAISLKYGAKKTEFFTSYGHGNGYDDKQKLGIKTTGPTALITDLAIWKSHPETKEFIVSNLHPGVSKEDVQKNCGWEVTFGELVTTTPLPYATELYVLRELHKRTKASRRRL